MLHLQKQKIIFCHSVFIFAVNKIATKQVNVKVNGGAN